MNQLDWKPVLERILESINNIETLLVTTTEESFLTNLKDYNAICFLRAANPQKPHFTQSVWIGGKLSLRHGGRGYKLLSINHITN